MFEQAKAAATYKLLCNGPPVKYCEGCKWFIALAGPEYDKCSAPKLVETDSQFARLVRPEWGQTKCVDLRADQGRCGKAGEWFEPKTNPGNGFSFPTKFSVALSIVNVLLWILLIAVNL